MQTTTNTATSHVEPHTLERCIDCGDWREHQELDNGSCGCDHVPAAQRGYARTTESLLATCSWWAAATPRQRNRLVALWQPFVASYGGVLDLEYEPFWGFEHCCSAADALADWPAEVETVRVQTQAERDFNAAAARSTRR